MEQTNLDNLSKELFKELKNTINHENLKKLIEEKTLAKTLISDSKFVEEIKNALQSESKTTITENDIYSIFHKIEYILRNGPLSDDQLSTISGGISESAILATGAVIGNNIIPNVAAISTELVFQLLGYSRIDAFRAGIGASLLSAIPGAVVGYKIARKIVNNLKKDKTEPNTKLSEQYPKNSKQLLAK